MMIKRSLIASQLGFWGVPRDWYCGVEYDYYFLLLYGECDELRIQRGTLIIQVGIKYD